MRPKTIDHLNLHIPEDGVDRAVAFYRDVLGFETANLAAYRAGDRSLFTFQPGEGCVIHVMPIDTFEPPGENLNHIAVLIDGTEKDIEHIIADNDIEVKQRRDRGDRSGADITIYVRDPFGYTVELRPEPEP